MNASLMAVYRCQLEERGLSQSMSRRGNCDDNATMPRFFGILKSEFYDLNRFTSVEWLKAGLDDYVRHYNHNQKRIKLKLKGLSPV